MAVEKTMYVKLFEKITKQRTYFSDPFEGIVIRSEPKPGGAIFFAKIKSGKEYQVRYDSPLVHDAVIKAIEITKEQYENF